MKPAVAPSSRLSPLGGGSRCAALVLAGLFALAGCGGLSDVGKQKDSTPPTADVVVLNQPFTKDASGKVTTKVRAGTEVFLSGKDSDGVVAPVLKYEWSVLTAGSQITLITRNTNTVSFSAPSVTTDTPLQFRLKVTDSNGNTDQKDVDVTVLGIPDGDHFLSYNLDDTRKIKLVAATSGNVTPAQLAGADVGFQITVKRLVDYTTPDVDGPYLEVSSQTLTGKWLAGSGAGTTCADPRNPAQQISVPAINIDDILAKVDVTNPAVEPNPALVDKYKAKLQITIAVTSGALPAGVTPVVCADRVAPPADPALAHGGSAKPRFPGQFAQSDPSSGMLEVDVESFIGTAGPTLDTLQSVNAYYATVDPAEQRTTFLKWLQVNGFVAANATTIAWADVAAGSGAHGVYTNNYDLGFGRDMYARIVRCDGAVPPLGQPIPMASVGTCDVAAVVINYASLEAASKKLNPVLAVAMEYSKTPGLNRRVVQFYTFAPDSISSEFKRVGSANLDGRGEKYMPQTCTVCHGGAPGGVTAPNVYANGGDINATFLPWDLDSFLFSDTTGSNSDSSYTDQTLRAQYTRAAQAEQLRRLNQLAYLTYQDTTRPNRYVLPRQLMEGWYGNTPGTSAFTSNDFNGQYVPPGWTPAGVDGVANTADDNPADSATIYHDVFSRNCRMCHVAHAPATAASGTQLESYAGANNTTFATCDSQLAQDEPLTIGTARQAPFACYQQFFHSSNLPQRLSAGLMPFARLTMDRFWVAAGSGKSAGDTLFDHLTKQYTAANDTVKLAALKKPGTAQANVQLTAAPALPADIGTNISLDASTSRFATNYTWTLERCDNTQTLTAICRPTVPGTPDPATLTCAAATEPVVGQSSPLASFQVTKSGFYRAGLSISSGAATASSLVTVTNWKPCASNGGLSNFGNAQIGNGVVVGLGPMFSLGNGDLAHHTLFASITSGFVTVTPASCASASGCAANTPVTLTPTGVGVSDVKITLRDQNGDEAFATARVTGTSSLSAVDITNRDTDANAALAINLLTANNNNPNVNFEVLTQTCPDGSVDTACLRNTAFASNAGERYATATLVANTLTYTPPSNFSTHDSSGLAHFDDPSRFLEQIRYRVVSKTNPNDFSLPAIIRVPVKALTTFTLASERWSANTSTCNSCHGTGSGGAPTYLATGVYSDLRTGDLTNVPGRAKVSLTNVESSGLLCYPLRLCTTGHADNATPTSADMEVVRQWIESGANNY